MAEGIFLSISQLATEFAVSRNLIRAIISEAGVEPAKKRGGYGVYRLRDFTAAFMSRDERQHANPHHRLAAARATKIEDEIKVRRRELIEAFEHEQRVGHLAKVTVQMVETLTDALERECGITPRQAASIEQAIDRWRVRLYEKWTDDTAA